MTGVSYEKKDADTKAIARAGIGLAVVTLVTAAMVLVFFRWLGARERRDDAPPPPLARMERGRQPPAPRLQTLPAQDLATVRAEEDRTLATYGWVDEQAGIVRIPIQEAMRILAERGEAALPRSSATPPPPATLLPRREGAGR